MDYQVLFNTVLGILICTLGWLLVEQWRIIQAVQKDQSKLREEIPQKYVVASAFDTHLDRIDAKLDKIYDALSKKADK